MHTYTLPLQKVQIHSDDHTAAYRVWGSGHAAPFLCCPFLARQAGKRSCWDQYYSSSSSSSSSGSGSSQQSMLQQDMAICLQHGLVGAATATAATAASASAATATISSGSSAVGHGGESGNSTWDRGKDLEAFAVPASQCAATTALALFDRNTQNDELVFRSRKPVLTSSECAAVVKEAQRFHEEEREGQWGTVRVWCVCVCVCVCVCLLCV